jgi:hypothetical protein
MYSRAYTGVRVVLGPSSDECQQLELTIASLDPTQGERKDISMILIDIVLANI